MKRILLSATLCMLFSITFAQKQAVKEAKKGLDSDKYSEAKQLIKTALTNPETANDPETWKVAADIDYKIYDKEKDKEKLSASGLTKEKPNFDTMFTGLYNSYEPYLKADSLGQLPDEKGKTKNKFRKDIIAKLRFSHVDYYNGGAYYSEKKDAAKAADYFERYWDIPYLSIFEDPKDKINTADTTFQIVKYYAAISAIQAKQHDRAIRMLNRIAQEPFEQNSVYSIDVVYEYLASEYSSIGDTVNFAKALEEGVQKYPKNNYFLLNLINQYLKKNQMDEALSYLDQAILNSPENACELRSSKAAIYSEKGEFEKACETYEKTLLEDPKCEKALDGLGFTYIIKAQELREESSKKGVRKDQVEMDAKANELYKKALPVMNSYVESLKARKAETTVLKSALYKLRNVYYNLKMDAEFDATEKAWNEL